MPSPLRPDCLHPGRHCPGLPCPDCGKFSRHSWATGPVPSLDGTDYLWGGECATHGTWNDSAL